MIDHPDNANLPAVNKPETILGVVITSVGLAAVAISLRLYVRYKARLWGWDDLFVLLAGIGSLVGSSLTCLMPDYGMGKHFWTLSDEHIVQYFKHVWSTNTTYTASTTLIKLAILFQYLRLFNSQCRVARHITLALTILVSLWGATFFFLALFSCRPIAKNWNFKLSGTCVAWGSKDPDVFFASWAAHAATNMLFDILIFILPIPFLRDLQLQNRTRLGLLGLFTMGGIVVTLSVARMVSLSLKRAGTVPIFDPTYATPSIYIFSVLEINIAILCASIPIFWPLVVPANKNKILVVNEIEIRSDRRESEPSYGLAGQGATVGLEMEGRTSRMSVCFAKDAERGLGRSNSTLAQSSYQSSNSNHRANPSTSSVKNKSKPLPLKRRLSQESQQHLNLQLSHQASDGTLSVESASPPLENEWRVDPLDLTRSASALSYHGYLRSVYTPSDERGEGGFDGGGLGGK